MKKKTPCDIIILHMCSKSYDHMINASENLCYNDFQDLAEIGNIFIVLMQKPNLLRTRMANSRTTDVRTAQQQ